jgi:hypothetical protein
MEKWEKNMKRKRALANVIIVSDDDEALEDEVDTSGEEVDTATSSVTVLKRRRVYHLIDESDED